MSKIYNNKSLSFKSRLNGKKKFVFVLHTYKISRMKWIETLNEILYLEVRSNVVSNAVVENDMNAVINQEVE